MERRGESPISLKGYRLMLNFWHRLTTLPDTTLVNKALTENIQLRTNWVITIEKLINQLKLSDKIGNHKKFKYETKTVLDEMYSKFWKTETGNPNAARLILYKEVKNKLKMEKYLEELNFKDRKTITKLRCSDHSLEIEKGRHRNLPRSERVCKVCDKNEIEDEEHFLLKCHTYHLLRNKHNIGPTTTIKELFYDMRPTQLAKYMTEAMALREQIISAT